MIMGTKRKDAISKKEMNHIDAELVKVGSITVPRQKGKALKQEDKNKRLLAAKQILSEYIGAFILIGYDLEEDPVVMLNAETVYQKKAVLGLMADVADDILGGGPSMINGSGFD